MREAAHLAAVQPEFAGLIERIGPCTAVVERRELYAALVRSIAHQQLHGNAARAILGRLVAHGGGVMPAPAELAAIPDETFRAFGFSGGKTAGIRAIAAAALAGTIPTLAEADELDDEALIARLVTIRGVGRWTVEMLLMSTLGRPDILPIDDFGVREGWRLVTKAEAQLKPKALAAVGAAWAPYRSTAAWYLWRAADEGKKIKQTPL
ncbi:MAG: DNA-3-methyladenine glycosylase family protein [Janthinobacterium lividum]